MVSSNSLINNRSSALDLRLSDAEQDLKTSLEDLLEDQDKQITHLLKKLFDLEQKEIIVRNRIWNFNNDYYNLYVDRSTGYVYDTNRIHSNICDLRQKIFPIVHAIQNIWNAFLSFCEYLSPFKDQVSSSVCLACSNDRPDAEFARFQKLGEEEEQKMREEEL